MVSRYTPADFCQGHGGKCDCYDNDYDHDHGVVSYCDGSCPDARWYHWEWLRKIGEPPVPSTDHVTLAVSDGRSSYVVRFEGADAEARALAYLGARWSTHAVDELEWEPFSYPAFPRLAEKLYPQCEHGLSASLCEGPGHYLTAQQEHERGW